VGERERVRVRVTLSLSVELEVTLGVEEQEEALENRVKTPSPAAVIVKMRKVVPRGGSRKHGTEGGLGLEEKVLSQSAVETVKKMMTSMRS